MDVCGHKCMTGLMMVYDCGRENACVCAVIRMHLGVMKSCMFIRAHGCRESFVCVHDRSCLRSKMEPKLGEGMWIQNQVGRYTRKCHHRHFGPKVVNELQMLS